MLVTKKAVSFYIFLFHLSFLQIFYFFSCYGGNSEDNVASDATFEEDSGDFKE